MDDSDIDVDDDGIAPLHMLGEDGDNTDNDDEGDDEDDSKGTDPEYVLPKLVKGSAEEVKFNRGTKVLFQVCTHSSFRLFGSERSHCFFRQQNLPVNCATHQWPKPHSSQLVLKRK